MGFYINAFKQAFYLIFMRKYEVNRVSDKSELLELKGKIVRVLSQNFNRLDLLLFNINSDFLEFIEQGVTCSSPKYLDELVYSYLMKDENLRINIDGVYSGIPISFDVYTTKDEKYDSRKKALENAGLWLNPSEYIH